MGLDPDLESLKQILQDQRVHLEVAEVLDIGYSTDRSVLRVKCLVLPEKYEVIAKLTFDSVGSGGGMFGPINVKDYVLIGFAGGSEDSAFIIKRLISKDDPYPEQLEQGHSVVKALPSKKMYMGSDTKTFIGKALNVDLTENLVLGQQLKTLLVALLSELKSLSDNIASHTHIGNLGFETSPPQQEIAGGVFSDHGAFFDDKKSSPVEDEVILSDIVFTEKGS
jgi:hypothetical protein